MATLRIDVLDQAVHSGAASGIVPSSFRILRHLLNRIENTETGMLTPTCYAKVPEADLRFAKLAAETLGDEVFTKFPFVENTKPVSKDLAELLIGGTW
jgi:hypothetical protein